MADSADALTRAAFTGEAVAFTAKHDGSPVTATDVAVEDALLHLVARARPDDGFLGEETGLSNQGPRLWIVDPIDGTRSFVAGGRAWGTLIALSDHGRLVVGVVSAPALGGRWWATVGVGARAQRTGQAQRELTVTSAADLGTVRWVCHPSLESMNPGDRELVRPLIERCGLPITPTTHGALMVAEGEADFCVQLSGGPWELRGVRSDRRDRRRCVLVPRRIDGVAPQRPGRVHQRCPSPRRPRRRRRPPLNALGAPPQANDGPSGMSRSISSSTGVRSIRRRRRSPPCGRGTSRRANARSRRRDGRGRVAEGSSDTPLGS